MKGTYPGTIALPMCLILAGALLIMNRFEMLPMARVWSMWPFLLIAMGLERLYLWTSSDDRQ